MRKPLIFGFRFKADVTVCYRFDMRRLVAYVHRLLNLIAHKLCIHGILGDRKYVPLNHNYSVDDRRGAVSAVGSLDQEWMHQTETYSDRVGISG